MYTYINNHKHVHSIYISSTTQRQKLFLFTTCCNPHPLDSWQVSYESHGGSWIIWITRRIMDQLVGWFFIIFLLEKRSATQATRNEDTWAAAEDDDDVYMALNGEQIVFPLVCSFRSKLSPVIYIYIHVAHLYIFHQGCLKGIPRQHTSE